MKRGFSVTKHATTWLAIGAVVAAASRLLFARGAKPSIEFTGGVQVETNQSIDASAEQALKTMAQQNDRKLEDIVIRDNSQGSSLLLKMNLEDAQVAPALDAVKKTLTSGTAITEANIEQLSFIGPSIGDYIKKSAIQALIIGIILMAIYMMVSFADVRKVISPMTLAIITVVTMVFDASFPAGMYALRSFFDPTIQINSIFVIAILTTIGYSINDTIIILDRIKENAINQEEELTKGNKKLANVIDTSIWQTMKRSLGTSISTLIVVIALFFISDGVIKEFAYVIGRGIIGGTFSSIFISATLLHVLTRQK